MNVSDPHGGAQLHHRGTPLTEARGALLLLHGRGASANSMLHLGRLLAPTGTALIVPQASGSSWYPNSFLAPLHHNEPFLSSALNLISRVVEEILDAGIPAHNIAIGGFSQGACLALEFLARRGSPLGVGLGLSGGLIGPDVNRHDYQGDLTASSIFLGCSDRDPHIPLARVRESTEILRSMGANVTERIFPGLGHTISTDEIQITRDMLSARLATILI